MHNLTTLASAVPEIRLGPKNSKGHMTWPRPFDGVCRLSWARTCYGQPTYQVLNLYLHSEYKRLYDYCAIVLFLNFHVWAIKSLLACLKFKKHHVVKPAQTCLKHWSSACLAMFTNTNITSSVCLYFLPWSFPFFPCPAFLGPVFSPPEIGRF